MFMIICLSLLHIQMYRFNDHLGETYRIRVTTYYILGETYETVVNTYKIMVTSYKNLVCCRDSDGKTNEISGTYKINITNL